MTTPKSMRPRWFPNGTLPNLETFNNPNAAIIFKSIEIERKHLRSFFEVNMIQIVKPDKGCLNKKIKDQYH